MKLVNHLTIRISALFILVLLVWSAFYLIMQLEEVHDGIDEGLNNLRQEFVLQANREQGFIEAMEKHNPLNIVVRRLSPEAAVNFIESYTDTKVFFVSEHEDEEVRMLTTAFLCEQDNEYYELKIFTSAVESEDLIKNMLYLLAALWIALTLTLIIGGKKIISKTNKPFYQLLARLENFHLDRSQMIEFPVSSISEYSKLNKSIEYLLDENIKSYTEQKYFIENSSHELQTPLAIAIGKLELLMNGDLNQQQLEEANVILTNLRRMKRLNHSLLLLSKIKNRQFVESKEIDLSALLEEILSDFSDLIEHKEIALEIEKEGTPIVDMNPDLAHILITNLIKNAIAHNYKKGSIHIMLMSNKLIISNDGVPLAHGTDMFERYAMNADNKQSSGLGLSIVKSIVDMYRMKIAYQYNERHIVSLTFNQR